MGKNTGAPASSIRQTGEGFDAPLVAGLTIADLLLIFFGVALEANPLAILLAHVLLLAACAWCFTLASSRDRTPFTFSLMFVLLAGPLGGLGVIIIALAERNRAPGRDILEAWYEWLSGEERPDAISLIHDGILSGREFKPCLEGPRNFACVLENGTLAEKQALLGHIGLRYHSDYFAVLSSALRSPQSAVRAQAAAIFVKLKEHFKRRLDADRQSGRAMRCGKDVSAMFACVRSIIDCTESGFLDPVDVREALADAKALCLNAASPSSASAEGAMLLCRIIAKTEEHDALLDHLVQSAQAVGYEIKRELALCLAATGRHVDLHRLLFAGSDPGAQRPGLLAPLCS